LQYTLIVSFNRHGYNFIEMSVYGIGKSRVTKSRVFIHKMSKKPESARKKFKAYIAKIYIVY